MDSSLPENISMVISPSSVFAKNDKSKASTAKDSTSESVTEASSNSTTTEPIPSTAQTPLDPCASTPCAKNGNCSSSNGSFSCVCESGWLGQSCTEVDFCASNPCDNGGICSLDPESDYICNCTVSWQGRNCSDEVNPCDSSPCLNGGDCGMMNATDFNCTCEPGYNGTLCDFELNPCDSSPCQNGAQCTKENGTRFGCYCTAGYGGELCEIELDPCSSSPCENGGNCTKQNGTHYHCACVLGFTGDDCEINIDDCEEEPCKNEAVCVDGINEYSCNCSHGWEGFNCTDDIDECSRDFDSCDKNANCTNTEGNYTCTCITGYDGNGFECSFINPCEPNPCNDGSCISVSHVEYECLCPEGWGGTNCSIDIDECNSTSHGCDAVWGVCNNTEGSYKCSCKEGSLGDGYICKESRLYPFKIVNPAFTQDDESKEFYGQGGVPISGQIYHKLFVYTNGYITFGKRHFFPNPPQSLDFPEGFPLLAPYWTDIDTSGTGSGSIFVDAYDLHSEQDDTYDDVMIKLKNDAKLYGGLSDFNATYVMVVTWDKVAPYPASKTSGKENATFQAVIATNSQDSFVLYNYEAFGMLWSEEPLGRRILVGYSDGKNVTDTFPADGVPMPWISSNIGVNGTFFYNWTRTDNENVPCLKWFISDRNKTGSSKPQSTSSCPCTEHHAARDTRLYVYVSPPAHLVNLTCYRYGFIKYESKAEPICCYDRRKALVTGEAASYLITKGEDVELIYQTCCVDAKLCHLYYKRRAVESCKGYIPPKSAFAWGDPHIETLGERMFTFNGIGEYLMLDIPSVSFILQGRTSHFSSEAQVETNATAFTAIVAQANGTDTIEVQRRQSKASSGKRDTTGYNDIAVLVNGTLITRHSEINPGTRISFNGGSIQKVDLPDQEEDTDLLIPSSTMNIQFNIGVGLKITVAQEVLSVQTLLDDRYNPDESITGLLSSKSITDTDGNVLGPESSEEVLYPALQKFAITNESSLFTYGEETFDAYNPASFTPTFYGDLLSNISGNFPDVNVSSLESICGASGDEKNKPCVIDFIATGSQNVAHATKKLWQNFKTDQRMFGSSFRLLNEKMKYSITVRGGTTMQVDIYSTFFSSSETAVQQSLSIPQYTNKPFSKKLYMQNERTGFQYLYWPRLILDNCGENGEGTRAYLDKLEYDFSPERFYVAMCDCKPGYRGRFCKETYNVCEPNSCFSNCTTDPERTAGISCGPCPTGMKGDGLKCYEENECLTQKPCEHICTNTHGSYACTCRDGYNLELDNSSCSDINECLGSHKCKGYGQYCHNTIGSYECRCKAGYFEENGICKDAPKVYEGTVKFKAIKAGIAGNQETMQWKNSMADTSSELFKTVAKEIQKTVNQPFMKKYGVDFIASRVRRLRRGSIASDFDLIFSDGSNVNDSSLKETFVSYLEEEGCQESGPDCQVGSLVGVDMGTSTAGEKDLCASPTDNDCERTSTDCTTSGGRFSCSCKSGFRPLFDYTTICQDINECSEGLDNCVTNTSVCENTPGSFRCNCLPGFTKVNDICEDMCYSSPCLNGGTCSRTDSGYMCKCLGTWTGPNCEDENEETKRYRLIAIIVGVVVGSVCLLLLLLLIYACCRSQQRKNGGYYTGSDSAFDNWETSTLQQEGRVNRSSDYEMTENGSKQNLLAGGNGRTEGQTGDDNNLTVDEQNPAESNATNEDYSSVNVDSRGNNDFPRSQGMQNPAYIDNLNNSNSNERHRDNI